MEPNLFNLIGPDEIEITYSTTSFIGQPQFHYKDENDDLSLTGDDIGVLATKIGTLVTVTLKHVPDEKIATFTLLLPKINLGDGEAVRFKAVGIKTTDRSSAFVVPGGSTGALQTYRTRKLAGVAEHVDF